MRREPCVWCGKIHTSYAAGETIHLQDMLERWRIQVEQLERELVSAQEKLELYGRWFSEYPEARRRFARWLSPPP